MTTIEWYDAFCQDAMLNEKYDPWVRRRKPELVYADVMITNPGITFQSGYHCWWYKYVGLVFFAELRFSTCRHTGKTILEEAIPVRLTNTKMNHGRDIPASSFIIL